MNLYYSTKVGRVARMMVPLNIRLQRVVLHIIIFKSKVIQITLALNHHIMEYNTCLYYHSQLSLVHVSSRATDDSEASL